MPKTVREQVQQCIEEVRPHLQADGGDIELIDVTQGTAKVKLKGACSGCPMSNMTMQWGVENCIKKRVPEIKRVEVVP
jgi:Fe-S cluster biogenesis protein NfuA